MRSLSACFVLTVPPAAAMLPDSPELQTLLALLVVAAAAAALLRGALRKNGGCGCASGECAALSPDVKKRLRKLKRRGS